MYIKELKVENYKSLKDSTIELEMGLNIIIGKNGAGKTNLLQFIYLYFGNSLLDLISRNSNTSYSISIAYNTTDRKENISYKLKRAKRKDPLSSPDALETYELIVNKQVNDRLVVQNKKIQAQSRTPNIHKIFDGLGYKDVYRTEPKDLDFDTIRELSVKYVTFELPENLYWLSKPNFMTLETGGRIRPNFDIPELQELSFFSNLELTIWYDSEKIESGELRIDSSNMKEYINDLFNHYIEYTSINDYLKKYTPITAIRFNPNINIYSKNDEIHAENIIVDFLIDGDWVPWSYLSDGTKRLFHLISECLSTTKGVILIEEPEIGVHPNQLFKVLDFLKEQSRTKQIIISTHSPMALDILKEDELSRIVIAKYENGTRFSHLNQEESTKAKKYMSEVGELSYYWIHSDLEK